MKSFLKKSALCSASCLQALSVTGMAVGAIALAAPAAAQDYTRGVLAGTVVDEAGAPIAGAEVTVRSNEQGFTQTTTTNASGSFAVPSLPTGTYTVIVNSGGSPIVEDRGATVLAGQTNNYRYIAGGAEAVAADEGIVVLGQRVQVNDFAATQTGVTLNVQELAETLPVSRDQTSLILLAPGTTGGDTAFGNLASISGATVAENAYYVNGLNITDFRKFLGGSTIPFEFYRTLDVKTGGYQAEYGRALGGVTSAVTKSGSNEFQAGVVATYSPDWLQDDAPNTFTDSDAAYSTTGDSILSLNEDDYRESYDASLYVSGPIIKDRLFFYALYQPRYYRNADTSVASQLRLDTSSKSPFFGGKIDFVIADGHRFEATYFRDERSADTDYLNTDANGDVIDLRGTLVQEAGGDNYIASYTGAFTDWLTLSATYGVNEGQFVESIEGNPEYAVSRISGPNRIIRGLQSLLQSGQDKRTFYRGDVDVYAEFFGEHHFRAGFDYEMLEASESTSTGGAGYRFDYRNGTASSPLGQIRREFYLNEGSFESKQRAFYIQDAWSLMDGRINLQLGLRNDSFKNYTVEGTKYFDSGSQWGPRLGATFDVFGDGATKLTGFWGRYYLPIAVNSNIRLGGRELYYRQVQTFADVNGSSDANGDGIPDFVTFDGNGYVSNFVANSGSRVCPEAGPDAGEICSSISSDGVLGPTDTLVSSTLQPSFTDEWILGLSHRMGDWTFGVNYINRRLGLTLDDVAVDKAVLAYCDANGVEGCADVWTGFHQYVLTNPGSDLTVRLDGDCEIEGQCDVVDLSAADLGYPKATRNYDAVQFEVDKAYNGLYGFNFNYTWTNLEGNYEGAVISSIGQDDAGLTQDFDQPGLLEGAYGPLTNGREHAFKLYGRVTPVEWLDIGISGVLESPRKFSCLGNYKGDQLIRYLSSEPFDFEYLYGAFSYYCQHPDQVANSVGGGFAPDRGGPDFGDSYLVPRGTAFQSDWNKRIDLGFKFNLLPLASIGNSYLKIDIFNVFNWKSKLDFNEFGDIDVGGINPDYGKVRGFQSPRSVRFTLALRYGGE